MGQLWYKFYNGVWYDREHLEDLFFISTRKHAKDNDILFIKWLYPRLGNIILDVRIADESFIKELVKNGQKITAIRVWKNTYNTSLAEAKEAVERICKE